MKKRTTQSPAPYPYRDFQRALDQLTLSLKHPSYALLLGESGTGKTTLLRTLAQRLDKSRFQVLYLCHGRASPSALARVLADTLHLPLQRTRAETSRLLMQNLKGLPTRLLLWIDECQLISDDTLHEIRLLAEADLHGPPLFSVVIASIPDLKDRLLAPALFPLWRRISVKASLDGLLREEAEPFLEHVLGPAAPKAFSQEALTALFEQARGIPDLVQKYAKQCLHRRSDPKQLLTAEFVAQVLDPTDSF